MVKHSYLIPAIISIFLGSQASAQTRQSLDATLNTLQKQATNFPIEKVYLHFDKPYYAAGDTIWLKAYTVIGAGHQLSNVSGEVSVELVNDQNKIVRLIKLSSQNGLGIGDIPLGDTITAGNYHLRAYTNWMRNFGNEYFFDKTFPIVNAISNKVFTHTNFTYPADNAASTVNADIKFLALDGMPYAGKAVNYTVTGPVAVNGNGVTDAQGNLRVSFAGSNVMSTPRQIHAAIQLDDKHTVTKAIPVKASSTMVDVQFFPESGSLVNGIISKVAFKAIGTDGLGAEVKGSVVDDQNNEVTTFASTHLGMGTFFLSAQPGRSYKAIVTMTDGSKNTVPLPKAADKGYIMTVHADSAFVVVKISQKGYENDTQGVTLVARNQGEVFLQGKSVPGKTTFNAVIPKSKLPTGVVQFTLFSATGEPLNERLVFVQNDDLLKLTASAGQASTKPRDKVKVKMQVLDAAGRPAEGDFSVSVIDESKIGVNESNDNSILANLLLQSELKGYIEQPNYYFANSNKTTAADLDALMLTQGYQRYDWKRIINNTPMAIDYKPESAVVIGGMLVNKNGLPVPNAKVTLMNNSGKQLIIDTLTDKLGHFAFNVDFEDGEKFAIKAMAVSNGGKVILDRAITYPFAFNKNYPDVQVNPDKFLEAYLKEDKQKYDLEVKNNVGNHSSLLKEVNVNTSRPKTEREQKVERAVEFSSNLNGKGNADQVIIADDLVDGCPTFQECLAGKLAGVVFINGYPYTNRPITFDPQRRTSGGRVPMLIVIDGIIPPTSAPPLPPMPTVSSIEVLKGGAFTAIYGTRAAGGVIIITTNHGNGFIGDVKGTSNLLPQGFYKPNVFYSPKYEVAKQSPIPDLRSTIYWNPSVKTDDEGNASFTFYNADAKGNYRVVIEGIDKTGSLGRKVFEYKVD